jgi:hypothetical protein
VPDACVRRTHLPLGTSKSYPGLTRIFRPSHQDISVRRVRPGFVFLSLFLRLEKVMTRLLSFSLVVALLFLLEPVRASADGPSDKFGSTGTFPSDAAGRSLNFGFETGTLADWTAQGSAFAAQPVAGDAVSRRRGDMHSGHAGQFWVGSFETSDDDAIGSLTSVPFRVSKPFASFLVGGGSRARTYVEIVRKDTGQIIFRASGDDREDLERVVVDLSGHLGQETIVRVVDGETGGWGHINFDDFRL